MPSVSARIAVEITAVSTTPVMEKQVIAAVALLDEGSTVPFISRYRKEVTGGLDDNQLRLLEERLRYLRELDDRRDTIIKTIEEQGKLTPQLQQELAQADTKTRLEDLYLPYKVKRRTKAQIAKEAGLEPLAQLLLQHPETDTASAASDYLNDTITDIKSALDGAKQILMERFAEDADLLGRLREYLWQEAHVFSTVAKDKEQEGAKFRDYFEFDEALQKIPSHRALALFRGRNEGILQIRMDIPNRDETVLTHPAELMVAKHWQVDLSSSWLKEVTRWTWRVKLATHLETELLTKIREQAEIEAIKVFSDNLKDLLLAAPAGQKATLGLDPGLRTGVKVAVVDGTGKHVADTAIFPHAPRNDWDGSLHTLAKLCQQHKIELISIGNGTASRETDKLAGDLIKRHPELKLTKIITSEAGASVYSASELAAREFPDLDVTVRGAISIARRLQDPLAELVKIEPKAIGVGQYQHDVSQTQLARSLEAVVEDCVNAVGVDLNTASSALLQRVAGLNQTIANNIVEFRNQNGAFSNRKQLKLVTRLGEKTFEQAAGFLRITNGDNPLDTSAVHPEAYGIVAAISKKNDKPVTSIIGDSRFLKALTAANYVTAEFGAPTINDIISELDKPGRDPRPEFKVATFAEGVERIQDLELDMILEGTVTNVTNFGAFIDIGVHQDGLVHISCLSHEFIKDPREVVRAGYIVKVKVLEIDIPRKRIGMSMRMSDSSKDREDNNAGNKNTRPPRQSSPKRAPEKQPPTGGGSMAAAFATAKRK